MKFYIANFSQIRFFIKNCIPISTCSSDPKFYHGNSYNKEICFVDKNGVMNGIREEKFLLPDGVFESLEEHCQENCPYKYKNPNCGFLLAYEANLKKLDFNYLLSEFERVAEDVRKITQFSGEPQIVLLVWEAVGNQCSERYAIKKAFNDNNIEIEDWPSK